MAPQPRASYRQPFRHAEKRMVAWLHQGTRPEEPDRLGITTVWESNVRGSRRPHPQQRAATGTSSSFPGQRRPSGTNQRQQLLMVGWTAIAATAPLGPLIQSRSPTACEKEVPNAGNCSARNLGSLVVSRFSNADLHHSRFCNTATHAQTTSAASLGPSYSRPFIDFPLAA
jgi:hypothetical protein